MAEDPDATASHEHKNGESGYGDKNLVQLIGRISADPLARTMPSGDQAVTWRVVIRRPDPVGRAAQRWSGRTTVDTIDCVAWAPAVRRRVRNWSAGDTIECEGSLRRRFWRAGANSSSRYEVEVLRAHRVRRG